MSSKDPVYSCIFLPVIGQNSQPNRHFASSSASLFPAARSHGNQSLVSFATIITSVPFVDGLLSMYCLVLQVIGLQGVQRGVAKSPIGFHRALPVVVANKHLRRRGGVVQSGARCLPPRQWIVANLSDSNAYLCSFC